ncbi:hypothetical protein JHK82_056808 [Glycine max]|nr:hypothetical protein JHK86_056639 [Glycine max]KAG4919372.1 hypothetical protein JHK85_057653 [Glycine max]KAG5078113.1 hypothetical protein JHK82_056808 [Glycine max]
MVSDANKKKVANEIVDILDFGFDLHLSPEMFKRKRPEGKKKKKGKRLQRKRHTRQPRAKKNAENGHALSLDNFWKSRSDMTSFQPRCAAATSIVRSPFLLLLDLLGEALYALNFLPYS